MERNDPIRNFRFKVMIDGLTQAGFSEVTMGESTTEAVDYREGTDVAHVRKLDGLNKYGNIVLKWGVTESMELYNWHNDIVAGQIQKNGRKKVTISVQDEAGTEKARFLISEAWPVKYHPSGLNGKGNEVFIELLELVNEGIERVAL
jgi:phage tail-like protein